MAVRQSAETTSSTSPTAGGCGVRVRARVVIRHRTATVAPSRSGHRALLRRRPPGPGRAPGGCGAGPDAVSYTHLRAHETPEHLVCRLLLEQKKSFIYTTALT